MATKSGQQFLHQGDVQLLESAIPAGLKKIAKKPVALGEKSGHQHSILGDYELMEDEKSNMYVVVGPNGATLNHVHESNFNGDFDKNATLPKADHGAIVLTPNKSYRVGIHKRYQPLSKHWENVRD